MNTDTTNNVTKNTETNNGVTMTGYHLSRNDDGTFCLSIDTTAHSITYRRADIQFGVGDSIVFPVGVRVLDNDNNAILNYKLDLKDEEQKDVVDQEEK